ncbi:hypothetical protein HBE96_19460 [Clostridium sp. P21]|uniref:DUF5673 domain-containing protein n=1 Tax=Clostridium muellerianum TaxID=2716538 RepID=A0A7Y0HRF7_9CLOT|nr:hypothetical protein [Clostridium muellerianum]NMM64788.1 hypothetical protein [Clostridium muellerianum]
MNLMVILSTFVDFIFLAIMIIFFIVKRKSGKSLVKIKNFEVTIFYVVAVLYLIIPLCIMLFKKEKPLIPIIVTMMILSAYLISCALIIKNSISEKGIIVLNGFHFLIKWNDIKRFAVNGKKIYFEKNNGYFSIVLNKNNVKDVEKILSSKINCYQVQ